MLRYLTFIRVLLGIHLYACGGVLNHNRTFKVLDINYLIPPPIWLDAYKCCYMLNKFISYQIYIKRFVLITNCLATIGDIQYLLNQHLLSMQFYTLKLYS